MQKPIKNLSRLKSLSLFLKKRLQTIFFAFVFLNLATFLLLLLPKPHYVFVFLLDVSSSMSDPFSTGPETDVAKIEVSKEYLIDILESISSDDYKLLVSFGPGNCNGKGLQWILNNEKDCGGTIHVGLVQDASSLIDIIDTEIEVLDSDTHLSEALYKTLCYLNAKYDEIKNAKAIKILVISDGQDHCNAISAGNSVLLAKEWKFSDKLELSVLAINATGNDLSTNLEILAEQGNGKYFDAAIDEDVAQAFGRFATIDSKLVLLAHLSILSFLILLAFITLF